jgi:hypothetical protein
MALKRERSESPTPSLSIFRSAEIKEQTSAFIAAFSPTLSVKALQALPEFRTATHRMAAWRVRSRQKSLTPSTKTLYESGHDDDGEKWAGGRLQRILTDTDVEGVVVVARWYGGHNIGPIRFTHIENTAKQAIWHWRTANEDLKKEQAAKKQKMEEEADRRDLEENLRERDLNIFVLRKLLVDKTAKLDGSEPAPSTPPKAPQDYSKMPLKALKKMDKARDSTIAFVLKQIDKVEEQLNLRVEDSDGCTEKRDPLKPPSPTPAKQDGV